MLHPQIIRISKDQKFRSEIGKCSLLIVYVCNIQYVYSMYTVCASVMRPWDFRRTETTFQSRRRNENQRENITKNTLFIIILAQLYKIRNEKLYTGDTCSTDVDHPLPRVFFIHLD